ncbi:MAG TPA: ABC transporter ATP-binding protein [Ktedonobacterales bacterium]|nr:ABC transporter ATP-binding protein [Ktedonobacterales bacterium]
MMNPHDAPTGDLVRVERISKTYPGVEASLRGTKLEWKGPALWARNLVRAVRLTSSAAPPVPALRDVSLSIAPGEIFGLVGPNGSGKTTLIKILAGLIRPTSGSGSVAGVSLDHPGEIRRKVSYVSTTGWMGLEWPLTAEENVRAFAALCGMPAALARVRAEEALRDVELWADRDKYPSQLSNGMRQRVILARALLFHTPLVLLDEPSVGLDPLTVQTMLTLFRRLCAERGQTILLADHQAAEMEQIADHIAILADGAIALQGTPAQLRALLGDVVVLQVHTEEMALPTTPSPPSLLAVERFDRPGALSVRAWRVYARKAPDALEQALAWLTQSEGRITLVAENAPSLQDILALPELSLATRQAGTTTHPGGAS